MFNEAALIQELQFKAVRSSGAGGQHVNKVSSKIELSFDLVNSLVFSEPRKARLLIKLKHRLTKNDVLLMQCGESRSQHKNKELIIKRFLTLIKSSLVIPKRRIATKIPKSVIRKRLKNKKNLSDKKVNRRKPNID
ncbi:MULTISPECIES: alternative ribosome rescue aminoacyl-tRNA hydrolase ArfB [unclassified Algibacter]|uniref:alternative ribosome rescue aminoacyl-tRNA hydrolase ArfB n=1 Tax=unclassified Algibacter TaxID=2615009 RepID=UPI00131AF18D|nr:MULTISPECIES: alternative ribosome rescue aminoacyl-tRNA hydrolase ArfB [unclassified Algibacter]MCL5126948.1 aminoacyl-tRNA hydrolase [Algibacter sp. L4_22]